MKTKTIKRKQKETRINKKKKKEKIKKHLRLDHTIQTSLQSERLHEERNQQYLNT
jgi:hypothetical protein